MLCKLGRGVVQRKWTLLKVMAVTLVVTTMAGLVMATPWDSWLDVVSLVLGVTNTAGGLALLVYIHAVERTLSDATVTEAEVYAILAAKRRLDGHW